MKLSLPQNRWNGDEPVLIDIPDDWDTGLSVMEGDSYPALSYEELKAKIDSPIGSEPIYEMAKGKKSACIVFDDNTRPTPIKEMAHIVLEELLEAGVPKDRIIFICALGCHGTCELDDFVKKLGEDICREYPVYNHNCFFNLDDVGTTSHGIKVLLGECGVLYRLRRVRGIALKVGSCLLGNILNARAHHGIHRVIYGVFQPRKAFGGVYRGGRRGYLYADVQRPLSAGRGRGEHKAYRRARR